MNLKKIFNFFSIRTIKILFGILLFQPILYSIYMLINSIDINIKRYSFIYRLSFIDYSIQGNLYTFGHFMINVGLFAIAGAILLASVNEKNKKEND